MDDAHLQTARGDRPVKAAVLLGCVALGFVICAFAVWSVLAPISGAIVVQGIVAVQSHVQDVAHPRGGRVTALYVRDGDIVEAGAPLLTLDTGPIAADLSLVRNQMHAAQARKARLEAERDGAAFVPAAAAPDPSFWAAEQRLFETRREGFVRQMDLLRTRQDQLAEQITGTQEEYASTQDQLALVQSDLERLQPLVTRGLVHASRMSQLRQDVAELTGILARLRARVAELRSTRTQIDIEQAKAALRRRTDAQEALAAVLPELHRWTEQARTLAQSLEEQTLWAPIAGVVHSADIHGIGSVARAGQPAMQIVPQNAARVIRTAFPSNHIDQLRIGQTARIQIATAQRAGTEDMLAELVFLAADAEWDDAQQTYVFRADFELRRGAVPGAQFARLRIGTPVQAYVQTSPQSVAGMLVSPLAAAFAASPPHGALNGALNGAPEPEPDPPLDLSPGKPPD